MATTDRHEALLTAARKIFDLEGHQKDLAEEQARVETQLAAARTHHLQLSAESSSPKPKRLGARQLAVNFLATHEPASQKDVVSYILANSNVTDATANQAVYDLSSEKKGWIKRTDEGLVLTSAGRAHVTPLSNEVPT